MLNPPFIFQTITNLPVLLTEIHNNASELHNGLMKFLVLYIIETK